MGQYNFRLDIKEGQEGEGNIINFLENKGLTYLNSNNDNKYDIKMLKNNKEITYEIKTDTWCNQTRDSGNIFVEFECRDKPSGIEVTEADWFVTYFRHLGHIWFIKTSVMKQLIKTENFKIRRQSGDAGSNTCGYLVPRNQYKEYFTVEYVKTT